MNTETYMNEKLSPYETDFHYIENYKIRSVDDVKKIANILSRVRKQAVILDTFLEHIDTEELEYWMHISVETDVTILTQRFGDHALFKFAM